MSDVRVRPCEVAIAWAAHAVAPMPVLTRQLPCDAPYTRLPNACRTGLNSDAQLGLGSANATWGARPRETGDGLPLCDLGQGEEVRGPDRGLWDGLGHPRDTHPFHYTAAPPGNV